MKKKTGHADKILRILDEANKPVSAAALKNRAHMTYDSVSKRIHDLRTEGFDIKTITRKGIDGAKATTYSF